MPAAVAGLLPARVLRIAILWWGCGLLLAAGGGCASTSFVSVRNIPRIPLIDQFQLANKQKLDASPRTRQVLRAYDLLELCEAGQGGELITQLQTTVEEEPTAEKIYALAEMNFRVGKLEEKTQPRLALDRFGAAVAYSYLFLFDESFARLRNPYDPQFRAACDLYNGSLESALRIVAKGKQLRPGQTVTIETASRQIDVVIALRCSRWHEEDFDRFEFAHDYDVQGLSNSYQTYGLGVPLIAIQKRHEEGAEPAERFYPPGLSFPVTAFLRLLPDQESGEGRRHQAVLELYDPQISADVDIGRRLVPLETDLTTPLAYFVQNASTMENTNGQMMSLQQLATFGLLRPDITDKVRGIYMLQPYESHKIPVVLVHGLWSSPLTWAEMFNDLRGQPEIRNHFQFWFYFYPTGKPFWTSAAKFRDDLDHIRATLDPHHVEVAHDQMILIGHSMGGLVSRLQTINSRNDFWNIASDRPFEELKATDDTRESLRKLFFFEANPSVRRVVTIGTPHRGSNFASESVRYLGMKLIKLPDMVLKQEVVRDNPGLFKDTTLVDNRTSLDSLSPNSPILPVMITSEKGKWMKYHNIVGIVPPKGFTGKLAGQSDGVVSFTSAHMDDVASEIIVPADHATVHAHPRSVLEVRRILLEHLHEVRRGMHPGTFAKRPVNE